MFLEYHAFDRRKQMGVKTRDLVRMVLLLSIPCSLFSADWPQWRGPSADGVSEEKGLPVQWGPELNILWKSPLPGLGTSTPIVYGDHVFVTSQIGEGPRDPNSKDFDGASTARKSGSQGSKVQFIVQDFARATGRLQWSYSLDSEGDLPPTHVKHNLASPSCVTDGRLVYAWFGTGQIVALTMEGKLVWGRHIGKEYAPFQILWGHGSSPFLYKDTLLLLCEHPAGAYLLALDKTTGKERWKAERGKDSRSYTTPFLVSGGKRDELIINTTPHLEAVDPGNGKVLWYAGELDRVPVPSPVYHDGIVYASRGNFGSPYMAVKTGGSGDVSSTHVVWEVKSGAPYVSSLLYYQGLLYMATENGIVSCIDPANGEIIWKDRFGGVFTASPVAAEGHVYLVNEAGEAFVLEAGREKKVLAHNIIPERTLASPAISHGQIFLRTDEHLIAVGLRQPQ
jgi:outer membrane protein assembly factor BamB